jgi:hypothetical protein
MSAVAVLGQLVMCILCAVHEYHEVTSCNSLDRLPSGMVLHCRLSFEGRQRRINTLKKGASGPPKTSKEKKTYV